MDRIKIHAEQVLKILAPFGKVHITEKDSIMPLFTINDLGRMFVIQGGWSIQEKIEKRNKYILIVAVLTLFATIIGILC